MKSEMKRGSLCERKMQAETECAMKKDTLGDDLGWVTLGKGTEADKSMACFNRSH